jgi:hypothetical protein
MVRTDIINELIQNYGYQSYLEIGTQDPTSNFDKIEVKHKVSIDPFPRGEVTFVGTSDEYFESIDDDIKYDIIFIDGLHHAEQVIKDIDNSINHLTPNGTIVCHDCLPTTERMQERNDHGGEWTGDVWKAIAHLRVTETDLDISVVNTDYGCGIIKRGTNELFKAEGEYLNWKYYSEHLIELMNVITIEEFKTKYNG